MRSTLLALLLLVPAVSALPAGRASAQDIVPSVLSMDGRASVDLADLATQAAVPISGGECTGSAQIAFRFTNVDVSRANLRFFYGTGCEDATIRTDTTNTSCVDLGLEFAVQGRMEVNVTLGADQLVECGVGTSGTRTIWVLALDEPASTVAAAGQKVSFPIAYDFQGPATPSGVTGTGGETAATLSWEGSSDQVTEYSVYFVPGGCSGGVPTSPIGADAEPYAMIPGTNRNYTLVYEADLPFDTESAVAIRAVDRAGNVSELSNTICVDRFEVTSWWDTYCGGSMGSADACGSSECAVRPGRGGSRAAAVVLLAAALALTARRRSR